MFPANTPTGHVREVKEKRKLGRVGHALRHTYSTMATAAGVLKLYEKALLNHAVERDVTDGYMTMLALTPQFLEHQARLSTFILERMVTDPAERRRHS